MPDKPYIDLKKGPQNYNVTINKVYGTVPVQGTVAVSGAVVVSGVNFSGASVYISGATVAISGVVAVSGSTSASTVAISGVVATSGNGTVVVSGTANVQGTVAISGTPSVNATAVISGVPSVTGIALSGTYDILNAVRQDNALGVACGRYNMQAEFETTGSWSLSAGAANLTSSVQHRGVGTKSVEFDKISGVVNAEIYKTITAFDMGAYSDHAIGICHSYLSDLTNVSNIYVKIGTDSSNYCTWEFPDTALTAGWNHLHSVIAEPSSQTGNGYDLDAITYLAFGATFDAEANTLADIRTGGWSIKRVLETSNIASSDVAIDVPFITIKDKNSNTRMDVYSGSAYTYLGVRETDGTNANTIRSLGTTKAKDVAIVDSSGNQITSFGSSTVAITGTVPISGTVTVDGKAPTDASVYNPSGVLSWSGSYLTSIANTFSGATYTKTITWSGSTITAVSAWS